MSLTEINVKKNYLKTLTSSNEVMEGDHIFLDQALVENKQEEEGGSAQAQLVKSVMWDVYAILQVSIDQCWVLFVTF